MKFLISADFYSEFEVIECDTRLQAINYITSNGENDNGINVIASHDNLSQLEALQMTQEVLFTSDYLLDSEV